MNYLNEQNLFLFLLQFFILLFLARGLGEVFRFWKQPVLTAEILVGLMMGPTILGRVFPHLQAAIFPQDPTQFSMLETIGWLGVFFLLLETGLEVDFSSAWRQRGDALRIALIDVIAPFVLCFLLCLALPDKYLPDPSKRLVFAAFMATAMSISAMPVAARALNELKVLKTDLGFLILSALSVNDIIGWLVFTLVFSFFTQAMPDVSGILFLFLLMILFSVFCMTLGRRWSDVVVKKISERQLPEPATSLTFICLLGLFCGAVTQRLGIHALFGFFLAGIMAGGARSLSERSRQIISQMVYAIFVPIFFVNIGLKLDFIRNFDFFIVFFIAVVGFSARFLGAWIGVKFTRVSRSNHLAVAVAHTPGGAMEIVLGILALEFGIISEPVFIGIVLSAVLSAMALGPLLSYAIKRRKEISILEYFSRRDIIVNLKAQSRDAALRELAEFAGQYDDLPDTGSIFTSVLERENVIGTGLENGVAVPHARLSNIRRAVILFGRSQDGIEWNSPDGKPARFIFLILTPQRGADVQVQILSLIAKAMSEEDVRSAIMKAAESQQIWDIFLEKFSSRFIVHKKKK
ncbi:MAG: cation:proton antiporter [Candidatus Omnitrophica bacterium]|nr:cation:proton antiporter [Candidatus Omnitrophota bacterium]